MMLTQGVQQRLSLASRTSRALPVCKSLSLPVRCRRVAVAPLAAAAVFADTGVLPAPVVPDAVMVAPPLTYKKNLEAGAAKAKLPAWRTFIMGILAGCFIAYGAFLALSVGANLPGIYTSNPGLAKLITGLIFPCGLMMVTLCGAELYTGNTCLIPLAMFEGRATFSDLVRNWFWSYSGNLVGSLGMVAAIAGSGMLATNPMPLTMALAKTSLPFGECLMRAMLCNWLVCIAVWQANSATTLPGKVMGLWPPIAAFVTIGLEHSVANMFFVPMGIVLGAKVSFGHFLTSNLIPVTLGNTLAGLCCMAIPYSLIFGALGRQVDGVEAKK